jgi:hypothetical protein
MLGRFESEANKDKRWIIIFSVLMILLTSLPYVFGIFVDKQSGWQFSGFIFGVEDGNSYIAKMLNGSFGDWLFRTPYTAYPQKGFLAFLPYILIGKLAASSALHTQLIVLFQLFRWVGIIVITYESYHFISLFIANKSNIRKAVILASIGGGIGWMVIIAGDSLWGGRLPLEFYSPETFGFLSIFGLPHLCFSRAFMLRSFSILIRPVNNEKSYRNHLLSGFFLLLSGFFQPLNIALGWLIVASFKVISMFLSKRKNYIFELKLFAVYILLSLPFLVYNLYNFKLDPYLKTWENQNIIKSPPVTDYLWAYGAGLLCVLFVLLIKKKLIPNRLFLITWLFLMPILIYFPINLQRRLADGVWIVMSIFIVLAIDDIRNASVKNAIILLFSLSTIVVLIGALTTVQTLKPPIYQSSNLIEVFEKLHDIGDKNDVVISNYDVSNMIPAYLPMRVVVGHGPESKNLFELKSKVDKLLVGQLSEADFESIIKEFNVKYIIYSFDEINSQKSERKNFSNNEIIFDNEEYLLVKIK